MGTRHLTCVVLNGEYKVAQYGQWDGYPTGQGKVIAEFLETLDIRKFKGNLKKCNFVSNEVVSKHWKSVGADDSGMVSFNISDKFRLKYPALSRDTGAGVLRLIQTGIVNELQNDLEFAGDSLFCEWVYIVDLDKKVVEVYQGFNKTKLKRGRFAKMKGKNGYQPVKLLKKYKFKDFTTKAMKELEIKLNSKEG